MPGGPQVTGDETSAPNSSLWRRGAIIVASCAALALALWFAFVALLALVLALTSDARIIANLQDASTRGVLSPRSYPTSFFGHKDHQFDMYTDCVALGINLGNESSSVLERVAASPTATREDGEGPCVEFSRALRTGDIHAEHGYLRFWHGYQAYFRVMLSIVPFDVMMRVTALLFFGALIFFAVELNRLFGAWAWAIALPPLFVFSDFLTVPMVATHSFSLAWAFFTASLTPLIMRRVSNAEHLALPLFAFAAGATCNFLHFLINPPLAPALIAFFYIASQDRTEPRKIFRAALYGGMLAALWFTGFFVAWIEKWATAAIVLGPDVFSAEIARIFGKYAATQERLAVSFLGATRRNLIPGGDWWFFGYIIATGAVAVGAIVALIRKVGDVDKQILAFAMLCAPLIVIVAWAELARAHSAEHAGFVSRSFLLFGILPPLAALQLWRDASQRLPSPE